MKRLGECFEHALMFCITAALIMGMMVAAVWATCRLAEHVTLVVVTPGAEPTPTPTPPEGVTL